MKFLKTNNQVINLNNILSIKKKVVECESGARTSYR